MFRALLFAGFFAAAVFVSGTTAIAGIQVGAAVRVITPDPLLPVSGGMGMPRPAQEKRGELTARAVVFRKGDVSVAVVALDLLGFPSVLGDRVRAKVSRIPAKNILIGSTHTHSAPDCYAFPDGKGGHTGDLALHGLRLRQGRRGGQRGDRPAPAGPIKVATGEAQGKIAYNYYAPDLYDRRMSVIQAVEPARARRSPRSSTTRSTPRSSATTSASSAPTWSARSARRSSRRPAALALFMNGAQGGMVTADNREPRPARRTRNAATGTTRGRGRSACGSAA